MSAGGTIAGRLEIVRARIAAAAGRAGRPASDVRLIGVTKTVPADRVQEAVEAGLADLGENRVQEAEGKIPSVRSAAPLTWHLVGRLQSNKAAKAISLFAWIHSIDSIDLVRRIDRLAGEAGVRPTVLIEVNQAGEATKSGVPPADLGPLLKAAAGLEHVRVAGLMSVPPAPEGSSGAEASRRWFRELRVLRDRWRGEGYDLPALSMGMTDDFEVAIEEGATHVRVGRAIFGERPAPRMPGP